MDYFYLKFKNLVSIMLILKIFFIIFVAEIVPISQLINFFIMTDLEKFGISCVEFPKVCVRIDDLNYAEVNLNDLSNVVNVLLRFGFTCTITKINE